MNDSKKAPVNTTADVLGNPMGMLLEADARGSIGNAIYAQEAAGQRSFTTSDTLPTRMGEDDRKVLEQAGVVFGDKVQGDEMFTYVTLPAGWKKISTSHSMWSDLVDDKGRKRASMFYKAAFYDRSAHLHTDRRFSYRQDYDAADTQKVIIYHVTDGEKRVFSTEPLTFDKQYSDEHNAAAKTGSDAAQAWLEEHYPNWEDASAYWD